MEYQSANPFYEPFENKAAGTISFTEEELFNAINDILVNVDKFKEKREALIKKTYSNIDNKNCERIVEFIRSLGE